MTDETNPDMLDTLARIIVKILVAKTAAPYEAFTVMCDAQAIIMATHGTESKDDETISTMVEGVKELVVAYRKAIASTNEA